MKTCILTPLFKRPEIVRLFLYGYQRLKKYADVMLVCIVSPEDKYRDNLIDMCTDAGAEVCEWSNKFLGEKKNAGMEFALDFEWDYFMDLGSDNIVNPKLFDLYKPYMEKRVPFFGLNNLYVMEWSTKKTLFVEKYNSQNTYGAGRMLLNDAIKIHLWPDCANEGLDTLAMKRLRDAGVHETVIPTGREPYILDIKTDTNINQFMFMEPIGEPVEFSEIGDAFGIPIYSEPIMTMQNFSGFDSYVTGLQKESGYNLKQAYEEAERVFELYFGKRRYKTYNSYKSERYNNG
jgi:hypothetical protein